MQALLTNLDPLMSALISDSDSDPVSRGILKIITTLVTTHILADILSVLARLSKGFQRQCTDFASVTDGVEDSISALDGFKVVPGPRLA